jgi:hypothetical protein
MRGEDQAIGARRSDAPYPCCQKKNCCRSAFRGCGELGPSTRLWFVSMNRFLTVKRRRIRGWSLSVAASALVLCAACGSNRADATAAAQLEQELQKLRADHQELQTLRAENQELPRLRRDNDELRRLREQTNDLARLREENAQLRGQLQALKAPKPKP